MFKKLNEVGKPGFLTVRVPKVEIGDSPEETIFVDLTGNLECITNSKERQQHFSLACQPFWQERMAERKQTGKIIRIGTPEHPLEMADVSVRLTLELLDGEFDVSIYRDINPIGYVAVGGCSKNLKEVFNPQRIATRELSEELLIMDRAGRVYCYRPAVYSLIQKNIKDWGLKYREVIELPIEEQIIPRAGNAQRLLARRGIRRKTIMPICLFVDDELGIITAAFFWRVKLPIYLKELLLFDGERAGENTLLKRPVRLTQRGKEIAIFDPGRRGSVIETSSWNSKKTERVMMSGL